MSLDTKVYKWLCHTRPFEHRYGQRYRALRTLHLKVNEHLTWEQIAARVGDTPEDHSANVAWARRLYFRAMSGIDVTLSHLTKREQQERELCALKLEAQRLVTLAVRQGKIKPASKCACTCCGRRAKENHHEDYTKPLEVIPLCKRCHIQRHKEMRESHAS